ncbi:head GIN domain-containing protein [Flagellimonas nanhaiensis]|uniref:Putative auto-transporter adhesin head GIN domain-containing protein n=1 Tax=Flagellimonas nanhaiensis TaxID=2292706 RepID=A0A371JRQ2_9FLAO|nr:head GIN domain-containing protein [Allomuricauda nanhaiensis]RDY60175.1 hypothetical protein DX873_12665 [Allomuricauda nanhaiensis]
MKILKTIFIASAMSMLVSSCYHDTVWVSDEISTRYYDFDNITSLQVATDFKAYVTFSDTEESVSIRANDNLFSKMDVYMEGRKLVVKIENNVNIKGRETLNLYVTTRNINRFKASSDASIFLETPLSTNDVVVELSSDAYFEGDITTDNFEFRATSDSEALFYVDTRDAYMDLSSDAYLRGESIIDDATIRLSSGAIVDLSGSVNDLEATMSSDSELKDYGLQVEDLEIELTSGSDAYLTANQTIDVTANSGGTLYYRGNAEIVLQRLSSGGRVIKD